MPNGEKQHLAPYYAIRHGGRVTTNLKSTDARIFTSLSSKLKSVCNQANKSVPEVSRNFVQSYR